MGNNFGYSIEPKHTQMVLPTRKMAYLMNITETGVLGPRTKLLRFHMPDPGPTPKRQIKRPGEGRERRFMTQLGTCVGRGRRSTQPVFSHLQGTDMSYGFK
jgi:hypothetical protein